MSVINISKLNYSVGVEDILVDVNCNINAGERIGIVGVNGAGKSTLLKLIVGSYDSKSIDTGEAYEANSGEIGFAKELSLAYLKQREHFAPGISVWNAVDTKLDPEKFEQKHHYSLEKGKRGILTSLGFTEESYAQEAISLSGGEQTRLALGAVLLQEPDILLLDEPTNHLDLPTLVWLENKLKSYKGTLLIVSHDRYFLDKVCTRIFEIENKRLSAYNGNYSQYREKKQIKYEQDLRHYENQAAEIARQEEIIRRFKEHNTEHLVKRAQSREKRLAQIDRLERPQLFKDEIKISFKQNMQTGNDVAIIEDLGFAYDHSDRRLFSGLEMIIKKGDRVCITGPNGCGKTTFLKMLMGEIRPLEGRIKLGTNVVPAYYDQQQENLNPNNTVLAELYNTRGIIIGPGEYASVQSRYDETSLRKLLGAFCFRGDDVFKRVGDLAGGEKARLSLLKLMMSGANVLILDEPTNHLDITSKEVFEDALLAFPGTEIIVSHDRYLIDRVSTRVYDMSAVCGGEVSANAGEVALGLNGLNSDAKCLDASGIDAVEKRRLQKEAETQKRRLERKLAEAEKQVAELEALVKDLENELCRPEIFEDISKANEISEKLKDTRVSLDIAYANWLELQE